jgi:hypothetical protein
MRNSSIAIAVVLVGSTIAMTALVLRAQPPAKYEFIDCLDPMVPPVFKLSQNYPQTVDTKAELAALKSVTKIDFTKNSAEYLNALKAYCFEGFINDLNDDDCFKPEMNQKKKWYHAPYMHRKRGMKNSGRDPLHGVTFELPSGARKLSAGQKTPANTYSIAYYNAIAAKTLSSVWNSTLSTKGEPDYTKVDFAEGSVCFKLLFTTTKVEEVDYLKGAPKWKVRIGESVRESKEVRLIQVDFAVKSNKASNRWIMGTLQFDADHSATNKWHKLTPVALSWGGKTDYINGKAPYVAYCHGKNKLIGVNPKKTQEGERANGPADNQDYSCVSCHSPAEQKGKFLDFSLQLQSGLGVWNKVKRDGIRQKITP